METFALLCFFANRPIQSAQDFEIFYGGPDMATCEMVEDRFIADAEINFPQIAQNFRCKCTQMQSPFPNFPTPRE